MNLTEVEKIIQRDLPGQRLSGKSRLNEDRAADALETPANEKPEAATPEFETMREKYLSEKFFGSSDSFENGGLADTEQTNLNQDVSGNGNQLEDVIVAVRPTASTNLTDDSSQLKTAVISAAEEKVIGQQG